MPHVLRGLLTLGACALLWLSAPGMAHAYEDEITLGLGIGYSNLFVKDIEDAGPTPEQGVALDVSGSYGLGPAWALRARATWGIHPSSVDALQLVVGSVEALYLIDVVEVVPYFGLGAGVLGVFEGGFVAPETHAVVGADYLLSRTLALGVDVRVHLLPTELDTAPVYLAALGTVTFMFNR